MLRAEQFRCPSSCLRRLMGGVVLVFLVSTLTGLSIYLLWEAS